MRNLKLVSNHHALVDGLCKCELFCTDNKFLYFYSDGNVYISDTTVSGNTYILSIQQTIFSVGNSEAINFVFHNEKNILVITFRSGDITCVESILFHENPKYEVVGCVDVGIKAADWSPEQDLLVLVTGNDTVVLMTSEFDVVSEVPLHAEEFGQCQFINAGWGKKETQFHGSAGKVTANAKPKISSEVISNDNKTNISWRGDGELFVISSPHPNTTYRYLRIFNREGALQYTSEHTPGLESALHWSSKINLIATSQRLPNKYIVSFFEKNGLKHGDFSLPYSQDQVKVTKLLWNADSKILMVWCEKFNNQISNSGSVAILRNEKCESVTNNDHINTSHTECTFNKLLHFFTSSNYNWHCKYTIQLTENESVISVDWDKKYQNVFHCVIEKEKLVYYCKYEWLWKVDQSRGLTLDDQALVCVISGKELMITAFRQGIIPPPMCTYSIKTPLPINSVTFAPGSVISDNISTDFGANSNDFLIQLCDGSLMFYKYFKRPVENCQNSFNICHELYTHVKIRSEEVEFVGFDFSKITSLIWFTESLILASLVPTMNLDHKPLATICLLNLQGLINDYVFIKKLSTVQFLPFLWTEYPGISRVLIQDSAGIFYDLNIDVEAKTVKDLVPKFQNKETQVYIDIKIGKLLSEDFIIFGLDSSNRFYINNKFVANNVTSYTIHNEYLLITTLQHRLLCLKLNNDMVKLFESSHLSDVASRKIERGARIVLAIAQSTYVILQMPRGNLECIQPRALSLYIISKQLDQGNYLDAFDIMRKQRINLNLIFDHNPELFLTNVSNFVECINKASWISLFLSELSSEDVTKTMYSAMYPCIENNIQKLEIKDLSKNSAIIEKLEVLKRDRQHKVNLVCDYVREALLLKEDFEDFLLPILTSYIKKGRTEDIEIALQKVKELREREVSGSKSNITSSEAMSYILYLIDVEELYKIALGLYDFDMVLLILNKSQKDPKEILPFLNELRKLEINYQKFTIDKYLKRYEKALQHILNCEGSDRFNECLTFIKNHKLYNMALSRLSPTDDRYKKISFAYGNELADNHVYAEAGIMFTRAGHFDKAMEVYKKVNNWREVISCSRHLEYNLNSLTQLYQTLISSLLENKQYQDAAIISLEYLNDVSGGVANLCSGKLWDEAFRVSEKNSRIDLLQNCVKPGIIGHFYSLKLQIESYRELFLSQKNRLANVRKYKAQVNVSESLINDEQDMYSDISKTASNISSRTSHRSYRSSKNRRKIERKILSLKEGSPYEDLALIASLHQIMSSCIEIKVEVKQLIKMLLKIEKDGFAKQLQEQFGETLKVMEAAKFEIWNQEINNEICHFGPNSTANLIADMHQRGEKNYISTILEPHLRYPPLSLISVNWESDILK